MPGDIVGAVAAGFIFLCGLIGSLVAYGNRETQRLVDARFDRDEEKIDDLAADVKENTRHVESLANAWGVTSMRTATLEDWAQREHGYHPPVIIINPDTGLARFKDADDL